MEKNAKKLYQFVYQKKHGGQDAIEFYDDGTYTTTPIIAFKDVVDQFGQTTKKPRTIQKHTLAYFDAITARFRSLEHMHNTLSREPHYNDYKQDKSYIGYIQKGYMNQLEIIYDDPLLAEIAVNADGSQINTQHSKTMDQIEEMIHLIEDTKNGFVQGLVEACDTILVTSKGYESLSLSDTTLRNIKAYRSAKKSINDGIELGYSTSYELQQDCDYFKKAFLTDLKSYKTFREMYRYTTAYKEQIKQAEIRKQEAERRAEEQKAKQEGTTKDFKAFQQRYDEVRQKETRPKQKKKTFEDPNQLSLFDLPGFKK